jgi:predicted Zn-dependent peptidase
VPTVERRVMDNGMVVFLVEDHDLPLVNMSAMIRTGGIYEPAAKVGLADMVGTVMRTGGTEDWPGDELDVFLENIGATVETGMDEDHGTASLSCLKENLDEVLPIFAQILRAPAFPQEKLDLAKTQTKSSISRRNDDAGQIAWREVFKLYFGADSPYARHPEYDTIAAIERGDLVEFHRYFYHPNNIILVAGGDFETDALYGQLEAVFADWPHVDTYFPPDPELAATEPSVNYVFKEDVNQSKIRMGHLGIRFDDEHLFPLTVLNEILGGGFASRLFTEVRSKRELAYAVYAWMIVGNHHRMPFIVGCDTKSESTVEAIEIIRDEIRNVTQEEVTEVELARAKEGLKNAFVFNFSSPFSIARKKASYEFWGRDPDFLDTYLAKVDAVTAADILTAAQARIHPDEMAILVVGREDDFDQPLSTLGAVNVIDITIPEPSFEEEALPPATPENLAEGRTLMEKSLAAYGGAQTLASIEGLDLTGDFTIQETPMGPMTFTVRQRSEGTERMRVDTSTPFGEMVQVLTREEGWSKSPMGVKPMSGQELDDAWGREARELRHLFAQLDAIQAQALGERTLDGVACPAVHILDTEDRGTLLFLDPESYLVLAMQYKDKTEAGPVRNLTRFEDLRLVSGWRYAHEIKIEHDAKLFATFSVAEVKINPKLDAGLFDEPAP